MQVNIFLLICRLILGFQPTSIDDSCLHLFHRYRVTNHDLVKCFRAWLTDPVGKEAARAQFKDYVNTLATIRQENGEKFLILKKKFYPEYYAGTSYLDSVTPSGYSGPGFQDSPNLPGLPGESGNYGEVQTTRRQPSSFYPEPPLPNR